MQTFTLFKAVQSFLGRKYNGTKGQFESGKYYGYFNNLNSILAKKFDYSDPKIRQYLKIVSDYYGERFDPFSLDSDEYFETFKNWLKVNGNRNSYKINVFNSCQKIYKFCKDKEIYDLKEYINKWGVSQYISKNLNENVAFVLGLQNVKLTKPERLAINKVFLKNTGMISERLEREKDIKKYIITNLDKIQLKLNKLKSRQNQI